MKLFKNNKKYNFASKHGFTYIELLIVLAVFSILIGISSISLSNIIPDTNFNTSNQLFLSDIKTQQFSAMIGNSYGVYLEGDKYTLFEGNSFDINSSTNIVIALPPTLNINNILFSNNSIVFSQNSGEIENYNQTASSFNITNTTNSKTEIINFNKLGVVIN